MNYHIWSLSLKLTGQRLLLVVKSSLTPCEVIMSLEVRPSKVTNEKKNKNITALSDIPLSRPNVR